MNQTLVTYFFDISKSHNGHIFVVVLIFSVCFCKSENQSLVNIMDKNLSFKQVIHYYEKFVIIIFSHPSPDFQSKTLFLLTNQS